MAEVPSLKQVSCVITVQALLDGKEDSGSIVASRLICLLETDSYTAVSGSILLDILENFPERLTDVLLLCLVPPHVRQLNLKGCSKITKTGFEKALNRCKQLDQINLSACRQILRPTLFQFVGHTCPQLTSVTLEECESVNDVLVKNLLKSQPCLKHLNISACQAVTDAAFMLNKATQLGTSIYASQLPIAKPRFRCELCSIDVSYCKKITSIGIRNLTSLCGATLKHVNINGTEANCLALLYLAGYSMYSALKVAMAADHSTKMAAIWKDAKFNLTDNDLELEDVEYDEIAGIDGKSIAEAEASDVSDFDKLSLEMNIPSASATDQPDNITNNLMLQAPTLGPSSAVCPDIQNPCDEFAQNVSKKSKTSNQDDPSVEIETEMSHLPLYEAHAKVTDTQAVKKDDNKTILGMECQDISDINGTCITDVKSNPPGTFKSDSCRCKSYDISWSDVSSESGEEDLEDNLEVNKVEVIKEEYATQSSKLSTYLQKQEESGKSEQNVKEEQEQELSFLQKRNSRRSELQQLVQGKLGIVHKLYDPRLISLEIEGIDFYNNELGEKCLTEFFSNNTTLQKFSMTWGELQDTTLSFIAKHSPHLRILSLVDCDSLTTFGVADACMKCHELSSVNLQGVCFFGDTSLMPLVKRGKLRQLNLAESNVTDIILRKIATFCSETLAELDLSWCEDIGSEDSNGLGDIVTKCTKLTKLTLRQCQMDEETVAKMSESCTMLQEVNLSSVNCITDSLLVSMSSRLRKLTQLDISWNPALTDVGISSVMTYCTHLKVANFAGIKQMSADPFLPIISNVQQWRRSQALLRLKLHGEKDMADDNSDDEKFEDVYLPHRSTVYATKLTSLDVEYCDKLNDTHMAEIVAVCRGTLKGKSEKEQEKNPPGGPRSTLEEPVTNWIVIVKETGASQIDFR